MREGGGGGGGEGLDGGGMLSGRTAGEVNCKGRGGRARRKRVASLTADSSGNGE